MCDNTKTSNARMLASIASKRSSISSFIESLRCFAGRHNGRAHPDRGPLTGRSSPTVGDRIRMVSPSAVNIIAMSIEDLGAITSPIHVRKMKTGYRLIDGAHRYAAATKLGLETIPAKVWHCTGDQAELMESDANISTAHMPPLELAVSLAARKKTYQKIHPETRQGYAGAKSRWGHRDQETEMSFASWMADVLGVTARQVTRIIAAGDNLEGIEIQALRGAPKPVKMADLYAISKIGQKYDRVRVCDALGKGKAKNATDALRQIYAKPGDAVRSNADKQLRALDDAFARAGKSARRQFVADHADALRELLDPQANDSPGDIAFISRGRAAS